MNINVMQSDAKALGQYDEFKENLKKSVDDFYCWDVAWKRAGGSGEPETLIATNRETKFSAVAAGVTDLDSSNLEETVRHAIENSLKVLDVDQGIFDAYMKEAGEFKFGLIRDSKATSRLAKQAKKTFDGYKEAGLTEKTGDGERVARAQLEAMDSEEMDALSRSLVRQVNNIKGRSKSAGTPLWEMELGFNARELPSLENPENGKDNVKSKAYEFDVTMDVNEDYLVLRRIVAWAGMSFYSFHLALRKAFDWDGDHLAQFVLSKPKDKNKNPKLIHLLDNLSIMDWINSNDWDMSDYCLEDLVEEYRDIEYIYDFGDCWEHKVKLVKIYDDYEGETPYLTRALKKAPLDDIGGFYGFNRMLEAMESKEGEFYEYYREWVGEDDWDPELEPNQRAPREL